MDGACGVREAVSCGFVVSGRALRGARASVVRSDSRVCNVQRLHGAKGASARGGARNVSLSVKMSSSAEKDDKKTETLTHVDRIENLLFVQLGMGTDTHGQDVTRAAFRAVKNAISYNSIPSSSWIIPGGVTNMRVHVKLGVPAQYESHLRADDVLEALPYGRKSVEVVAGGLTARSGIALPEQGDAADNDDMIIVVASVEVGW
mmetsp:Transcript_17592/g.38177  ORF Transcript_17592/g.38177 Transcript_17592/m.38177 type:complete len:204 (-) Transcript_17592:1540-2151(-)